MRMDQSQQNLPVLEQDIVVGFSYKMAFLGIAFCIGLLAYVLFLQEMLLKNWDVVRQIGVNWFYHLILPLILILVLSGEIWHITKPLLFGRGPALIVSPGGIHFTTLPWKLGKAFITWSEIKAIYSCRVSSKEEYFCVSPRIPWPDVALFGRGKRRFQRISLQTGAPINIPEYILVQPASMIIRQIRTQYAQQLSENGIEVGED